MECAFNRKRLIYFEWRFPGKRVKFQRTFFLSQSCIEFVFVADRDISMIA